MSYICLSNGHGSIYNCNQTILFIGVNVIFSEIDKNPHHLKLRNKQGALVLPDIFETYYKLVYGLLSESSYIPS